MCVLSTHIKGQVQQGIPVTLALGRDRTSRSWGVTGQPLVSKWGTLGVVRDFASKTNTKDSKGDTMSTSGFHLLACTHMPPHTLKTEEGKDTVRKKKN